MNRVIGYVSIAIILILLAVSVFLISNTVTIGISVRKEEIGIMKLIGATNLFVRAPFLIEGILIGLVGAAIPLGLLYVVYNRVISYVMTEFSVLSNFMAFMRYRPYSGFCFRSDSFSVWESDLSAVSLRFENT